MAILWPVKAIFEKRAATVEVDIFISPAINVCNLLVHRKCLMKAPEVHERIPARKPCVKDGPLQLGK